MSKRKFLKIFETFHREELESIVATDGTYVRRKPRIERDEEYIEILETVRVYDVRKFIYERHPYGIYIKPDDGFLRIIDRMNDYLTDDEKIPHDFDFTFSVDNTKMNLVEFELGVPTPLRRLSLGYKLYKLVITDVGYVTSNRYSTPDAHHIWYNLMLDPDLYCFTSTFESGVIHKAVPDDVMRKVLEGVRGRDLIFDGEIRKKIIEFYGSMDIYKQEVR